MKTPATLAIHNWYESNQRPLPWRESRDPYKIWVSEIILQQTQVAQGLGYYHRFLEAFPDIGTLASAPETEVMKQWQGLGYYSRARNMHHTAKTLVEKWDGQFPQTYRELLSLKGIGPYTAAAIASIAFGLPQAVVDGNVFRVLSRLFAIDTPIDTPQGKKQFEQLADELLDKDNPSTHNQALMEMGAIICRPARPQCSKCPLTPFCKAFGQNEQQNYPVKSKRLIRKKRYLNFLLITNTQQLLVHKRTDSDIWKGLYQLPLIETNTRATNAGMERLIEKAWNKKVSVKVFKDLKHLLTHQELHLSFYHLRWPQDQKFPNLLDDIPLEVISKEKINDYPFPQPLIQTLREFTGGPSLKITKH